MKKVINDSITKSAVSFMDPSIKIYSTTFDKPMENDKKNKNNIYCDSIHLGYRFGIVPAWNILFKCINVLISWLMDITIINNELNINEYNGINYCDKGNKDSNDIIKTRNI